MRKILIINDSRFERLILRDMLNRLGYSVKDTDEFISMRQIDGYDPDIIVVNRTMYDISGLELIDMIKSKNSKYRCYLSSCSPLKIGAIKDSQADGAFQTPIGISELRSIMEGQESIIGMEAEENGSVLDNVMASSIAGDKVADTGISAAVNVPEEGVVSTSIQFCPYCGGDLRGGSAYAFCPFCGKKL